MFRYIKPLSYFKHIYIRSFCTNLNKIILTTNNDILLEKQLQKLIEGGQVKQTLSFINQKNIPLKKKHYDILINGATSDGLLHFSFDLIRKMSMNGFTPDKENYEPIFKYYSNSGKFNKAFKLLKILKDKDNKIDVSYYNTIASGYENKNNINGILKLINIMKNEHYDLTRVYNYLIQCYIKRKSWNEINNLANNLELNGLFNIEILKQIITSYSYNNDINSIIQKYESCNIKWKNDKNLMRVVLSSLSKCLNCDNIIKQWLYTFEKKVILLENKLILYRIVITHLSNQGKFNIINDIIQNNNELPLNSDLKLQKALFSGYLKHDKFEEALIIKENMKINNILHEQIYDLLIYYICFEKYDYKYVENLIQEMKDNNILISRGIYQNLISCYIKNGNIRLGLLKLLDMIENEYFFTPNFIKYIKNTLEYNYNTLKPCINKLNSILEKDNKQILLKTLNNNTNTNNIQCFKDFGSFILSLKNTDRIQNLKEIIKETIPQNNNNLSTVVTGSLIIKFQKASTLQEQQYYLKEIEKLGTPNLRTCGAIINHYVNTSNIEGATKYYNYILEIHGKANIVIYTSLVRLFANNGKLEQVERIIKHMETIKCYPDILFYDNIIKIYCKRGLLNTAQSLFEHLKLHCNPDSMVYSHLILANINIGRIKQAEDYINEMKLANLIPLENVYVNLIQHYLNNNNIPNIIKTINDAKIHYSYNTEVFSNIYSLIKKSQNYQLLQNKTNIQELIQNKE